MSTERIDPNAYGKAVRRLATAWPDEERQQAYLREREASYQRIADGYRRAGAAVPPRTILSGE